jgi:hypothetical protein
VIGLSEFIHVLLLLVMKSTFVTYFSARLRRGMHIHFHGGRVKATEERRTAAISTNNNGPFYYHTHSSGKISKNVGQVF